MSASTMAYLAAKPSYAGIENPPASDAENALVRKNYCMSELSKNEEGEWQSCNRRVTLLKDVQIETFQSDIQAMQYDKSCPAVASPGILDRVSSCESQVSLYDVYVEQTQIDLEAMNEPDKILSQIYHHYTMFGDNIDEVVSPACTAYESLCERCELVMREVQGKLSWRWDCGRKADACSQEEWRESNEVSKIFHKTYQNKPELPKDVIKKHVAQCVEEKL
jgi:hypothetical protein